jgi:hypothetical protein
LRTGNRGGIFEPKRDEVTGDWSKLRNEEPHNFYSSSDVVRAIKSRRMRWAGYVVRMEEKKKYIQILVAKSEGKRPLGSPKSSLEDNIKMYLRDNGL